MFVSRVLRIDKSWLMIYRAAPSSLMSPGTHYLCCYFLFLSHKYSLLLQFLSLTEYLWWHFLLLLRNLSKTVPVVTSSLCYLHKFFPLLLLHKFSLMLLFLLLIQVNFNIFVIMLPGRIFSFVTFWFYFIQKITLKLRLLFLLFIQMSPGVILLVLHK